MDTRTNSNRDRFLPTCYDDFTDPAHAPLDMAAEVTGSHTLLSRHIWGKRLARGSSQTQIAAKLRMSRHRICRRMNAMRRRLGCATLRRLRGNQTAAETFSLFAFGHCNETPNVRLVIDRLAELSPVELSVLSALLRFLPENETLASAGISRTWYYRIAAKLSAEFRIALPGCALARSGRNMISFSSALPWASCRSSRILSFVVEDTDYTRSARPKATRIVAPVPYNCRKLGGGQLFAIILLMRELGYGIIRAIQKKGIRPAYGMVVDRRKDDEEDCCGSFGGFAARQVEHLGVRTVWEF